MTTMQQQ